jgi:hypothetical protein
MKREALQSKLQQDDEPRQFGTDQPVHWIMENLIAKSRDLRPGWHTSGFGRSPRARMAVAKLARAETNSFLFSCPPTNNVITARTGTMARQSFQSEVFATCSALFGGPRTFATCAPRGTSHRHRFVR